MAVTLYQGGRIMPDCLFKLKELSGNLKDSAYRNAIKDIIIEQLGSILKDGKGEISCECSSVTLDIITESFRCLRNACAQCEENQQMIRRSHIFQTTFELLALLLPNDSGMQLLDSDNSLQNAVQLALRCGVQFLGNASTGMACNQQAVWNMFCPMFSQILNVDDSTLANYACMVIYNCLDSDRIEYLMHTAEGVDLTVNIIKKLTNQDSEWGMYIVEKLVSSSDPISPIYSHLCNNQRLIVLEVILSLLQRPDDNADQPPVSSANCVFVASEFKTQAQSVLSINTEEMEPLTATKQLEILCSITSNQTLCPSIRDDADILKYTVNLLHCIHMIGREGDNAFTTVGKLGSAASVNEKHPVYGLKRDLIRLLANMLYQHSANQDRIREVGGIPLILDHTNIDARNPYITQWAIFAVRNLCENNKENQQVVNDMRLEGVADNIQLLRDFGVEAELEGDRIVIKQVEKSVSPFPKPTGGL